MGGAIQYVYRDGQRLTPWMKHCVDLFSAAFFQMFGLVLYVSSGLRTYQDQVDIFLKRYVTAGNIRGRKIYDTRVWNGVRYYRIDPTGTVAVPGTSNHEIQRNYYGAVDLRDSGKDAGISRPNNPRSNWARANAHRFGLEPEGYNFKEPWHFRIPNIFRTPPATPAGQSSTPNLPKESDNMQSILVNGHKYGVDTEFLTHYGNEAQATITRQVTSATDEQHKLASLTDFQNLLDGLGIPRNVVDGHKGQVYNPQSGKFERNGTWSRRREILAGQARIEAKLNTLAKAAEVKPTDSQ